jgi:hypothetical protein
MQRSHESPANARQGLLDLPDPERGDFRSEQRRELSQRRGVGGLQRQRATERLQGRAPPGMGVNCRPHARAAALEAQNASSLSSMMSRSLFGTNCISLTTRGSTSCAKNFADAIFPS